MWLFSKHTLSVAASGAAVLPIVTIALIASAQDVQVNQADVNLGNNDNSTTQSETKNAVVGSTVVVGWNDTREFASTGLGGLTSITGYGFSQNNGVSFTDAGLLAAPAAGYFSLGDPAFATDAAGNIFFATLAQNPMTGDQRIAVYPSTSTSPNVTFGAATLVANINANGSADKQFIAADNTGGPFSGRIYIAWSEFVGGSAAIAFARSTSTSPLAFAATQQLVPANTLNQGAEPAVGPGGEVYVVYGAFGGTTQDIRILKSTDGGATFDNPDPGDPADTKLIATSTRSPNTFGSGSAAVRNRGFPRIAADRTPFGSPTRGNVYVVWHADPDDAGTDNASVYFSRSTDGGATWSRPRTVNAGPAVSSGGDSSTRDNWQPAIAVSPVTGQVTVSFYDRRDDPANTNIRVYRAFSTDGGLTFTNDQVSTAAFTPNTSYDPLTAFAYMGDYNDAVGAASGVHLSWGDLRNTCSPPTGAPSPCSPVGRSDQDVFYRHYQDLTGPDPAITPWGHVTGEGPAWQTPDIFVEVGGVPTNAAKGALNPLKARVRNVGTDAATEVTVRFLYAPWFAGITPAAFKEIGVVSETFAARGDLLGNDLKVVPIVWDLTDLNDDNGGLWPMPISAFDHFCVKVQVELAGDVNIGNNTAQNNFTDVPTLSGTSVTRFLIGNPFQRSVEARLFLRKVPEGFRIDLKDFDGTFGKPFTLKPEEIRVATLAFTTDRDYRREPSARDLVADIDFEVADEIVGGVSVRLVRGSDEEREGRGVLPEVKRSFDAPTEKVFEALLEVLREREYPVSLANREKLLVNTGSIRTSVDELRQRVVGERAEGVAEKREARFLMSFKILPITEDATEIAASAMFIASTEEYSPLGGSPIASNGSLEREILEQVAERLR